jgi:polar amino acid transport system ATP-binding protein
MLEVKNLSKSFNGKKVLDDISFSIKNGEIALFLGSSGVGKSTLLRILNNLETFESGKLFLDNKQLDINKANKTHSVGMVFQQFNLFDHMTVLKNITFVLEKGAKKNPTEAKKIAYALLQKYKLEDKANLLTSQLSGGQKQRLAIARTLSLKPRIICLDEPTSALDPLLTSFVAQNIQELASEGYIVIVASHDIALLERLSCKIYLMKNGKIVEYANSEEFKKDKDKFPLIRKFVTGTT